MDRSDRQTNERSRERLCALVARLSDQDLARPIGDGWTVAAALAHLAFWDRWVVARWAQYDRDGAIESLPDGVLDLANAAGLPLWLALNPERSADLALAAADEADRLIAGLQPAAIDHALTTSRPAMVDRSLHRDPHLDEIVRALAGA